MPASYRKTRREHLRAVESSAGISVEPLEQLLREAPRLQPHQGSQWTNKPTSMEPSFSRWYAFSFANWVKDLRGICVQSMYILDPAALPSSIFQNRIMLYPAIRIRSRAGTPPLQLSACPSPYSFRTGNLRRGEARSMQHSVMLCAYCCSVEPSTSGSYSRIRPAPPTQLRDNLH
jgi:hypothetical protein